MNRPAFVTTAFGLGVLLVSACSCPAPTTPTNVTLKVEPASVQLLVGTQVRFCGSGTNGPYAWTLSGGGTVVSDNILCATLTAGTTTGPFLLTARSGELTATATVNIVAERSNFVSLTGSTTPGPTPVTGCRAIFNTYYMTAEDGLRMRAVLYDASEGVAPPYLPTSASLGLNGQVLLQGGTTNRTTEAVELVFSRDGVDVFRMRFQAHYVWPSCG